MFGRSEAPHAHAGPHSPCFKPAASTQTARLKMSLSVVVSLADLPVLRVECDLLHVAPTGLFGSSQMTLACIVVQLHIARPRPQPVAGWEAETPSLVRLAAVSFIAYVVLQSVRVVLA